MTRITLSFIFISLSCSSLTTTPCDSRDLVMRRDSRVKILDNALFTKATGIYVSFQKSISPAEQATQKENIKRAYLAALTLWGSSLSMASKSIDQAVRDYLSNATFKSGGISIYNAPLVDIVGCQEDASVVIQVLTKFNRNFPGKELVIALSQMPGRTIILNAETFDFYYDQRDFNTHLGKSINLTVVLAHEIGHSLGLKHEVGDRYSIMLPNFNDLSFRIPSSDGILFSRKILENIDGPKPGFYEETTCEGLTWNQ